MPYELQIQSPDAPLKRVKLEGQGCTLGRAHSNDLCYPEDASLSRRHLNIAGDGANWTVEDLGSKNGTLVNGTRLNGKHLLQPGDRLTVGQLMISFVDPELGPQESSVIFVPGTSPELHPSATVMTSLEGLLSGDSSADTQGVATGRTAQRPQREFDLPIVRALIRAGRELVGDQPLEELFTLILDLSIDAVGAERGVLLTIEGEGGLRTRAEHGEGFRISTTIRDRVLQNKASVLVKDVAQEQALLNQHSISEQQIHSLMAVPLQTESSVIGLIYLDSRLFVREFTPDDLNLLTILANVAAIRLERERLRIMEENERRRTRDLEQAAEIQRGILPLSAPQVAGLDLAGYNAPCRTVGGDYYDFIQYPDGRVGVVLGDVAGKGMSAALLMSSLQARVQLLFEDASNLATMMERLDKAVSTNCPSNRFITMFMCMIDPANSEMFYCNAGHNPALLIRASGEVTQLSAVGTVLGILPDLGYEQQVASLGEGDLIAIYSDGVTEEVDRNDAEFGEERLTRLLVENRHKPAQVVVDVVKRALDEWAAGAPPADDVTLVVARRSPTV
jgi:serine phosphatase RsbU (regulator of sigma subunit)